MYILDTIPIATMVQAMDYEDAELERLRAEEEEEGYDSDEMPELLTEEETAELVEIARSRSRRSESV